jgi:transposase
VFLSNGQRYTQEFKVEAVKQITERGYPAADVPERLGICSKPYITGEANYQMNPKQAKSSDASLKRAKLEAELKRVTQERDAL